MHDPGDGIRFDFQAAADAAHELRVTAIAIEAAVGHADRDLPIVTEDWHGRSRAQFDATVLCRHRDGRFIASAYRLAANEIEAHAILARTALNSRVPR
jgi:uncharacterized protein YukE